MKKKLSVVLILIISGFIFYACADDSGNNDSRGNAQGQGQGQGQQGQGQGQKNTYGIDISNWPQGDNYNGFWTGLFYRKSEDSTAIAVNPMRRGDGTNSIPDIYVLAEKTGDFPLGTWGNSDNSTNWNEFLIFTSGTITLDSSHTYDLRQADYTMTEDMFNLSNSRDVPYTPTPEDAALLATYNEANFRSSRPWIPATSTITARVKKGVWFYEIADNPMMPPFTSNSDIVGTWLVCDFISEPNTYNPANPEWPDSDFWNGIRFNGDGTVNYRYSGDNDWGNFSSGTWTTTTDTYVASVVTSIKTGGIIIESNNTAPEFVIKEYPGGLYLFAQWKSGDYTHRGDKPHYYVFKKAD